MTSQAVKPKHLFPRYYDYLDVEIMRDQEYFFDNAHRFEALKYPANQPKTDFLDSLKHFGCGFVAGVVGRTFTAPFEILKVKYQTNYIEGKTPPSVFTGLRNIYVNYGFRGLFTGNLINIAKSSPDTAIRLFAFDRMKRVFKVDKEKPSFLKLFLCGAISGSLSSFCIFPLEVIKVRLQASPKDYYRGIRNVIFKIYTEEEGLRAFYKGVSTSICAAIPNAGLNLMTYDSLRRIFVQGKEYVHPLTYMLVGSASAFCSSSLLYPMQTVTSRVIMAGLKNKKTTPFQVIYNMVSREGVYAFYKGFTPGMTKIVFGNGFGFFTYETCKKAFNVK